MNRWPMRPAFAVMILTAMAPASSRAASFPGGLYEAFGSEVAGLTLSQPVQELGALGDPATNVVAGGGVVYFEGGPTIFSSTPILQGLTTFHVNNATPTGLALDVADGIIYESISGEIAALSTATAAGVAFIGQPATNMVFGDGKLYFEVGNEILTTSPTLVGVDVFHVNNAAPTGLAFDTADNILYESFGADGIAAIDAATGASLADLGQPATNMVFGDGKLYFQDGTEILTTSPLLQGVDVFHINGAAPTGLAFLPPASPVAAPEPPTVALTLLGLAVAIGFGARARRRVA